eukprot:CAMPEP_0119072188 /NCGR_PEP_ID=MMETSP1178-20130426/58200_1 /TAXON_ID=33656 /ORGANISM="unid sp, Strain CCMP2000" /LENGTH=311 /DNA_ID=CAMNT_0007054175 /DNA_START=152 /DNA_END=1087 /DNA_ORIENTATION=-
MASGKNKKSDLLMPAADLKGALALLKELVETAKKTAKGKKLTMWDFRSSPHAQFGRSLDDAFKTFLMWGRISADDDDDDDGLGAGSKAFWAARGDAEEGVINVSKAFRRLEAYAEWMEDTGTELMEPPLIYDAGMAEVHKTWGMSTSVAASGQLIWWIDMGSIDLVAVKTTPVEATFRYMVWFAHAVMYNENAMEHGMAFCECVGSMGFWTMMTMFPMKLSAKLDRLTIGTLPVKMKCLMILDPPKWMALMMSIMGAFMSAKMKKRMVLLKGPDCWAGPAAQWGAGCVPKGFAECGGANTVDPVAKAAAWK